MFIKPLIFYFAVRKFVCVHREAQQIFMGLNTEYRANLVKNQGKCSNHFASHILGQYKLFLISEDWEGFTEPSEPSEPSLECHWSDNQYISNSNTVFSSFVFYSDFGFKYFLEFVGKKITI